MIGGAKYTMDDMNDFELEPTIESAEDTIDQALDIVQEEDADTDFEASTVADDPALDDIVGFDGSGSSELISDKDIDDIAAGKEPDVDIIDNDAYKGKQDAEIDKLSKDINNNSIISKDDVKDLKEGMSIEDYVGKVLQEEFPYPGASTEDMTHHFKLSDDANECPVCHCCPCICPKNNPVGASFMHRDTGASALFGTGASPVSPAGPSIGIQFKIPSMGNSNMDDDLSSDSLDFDEGDWGNNPPHTDFGSNSPSAPMSTGSSAGGTDFESGDNNGNDVVVVHTDDIDDDLDDDFDNGFDEPVTNNISVTHHVYDPEDNTPAGPVMPVQGSHMEEGDFNMYDDDDLDFDDIDESYDMDSEYEEEPERYDEGYEEEPERYDEGYEEEPERYDEGYEEEPKQYDESADDDIDAELMDIDEDFAEFDDDLDYYAEDVKGRHLSDDQVEDLTNNAMDYKNLDSVSIYNDFEGAGINASQHGPKNFLTGDRTYRGEDGAENTFRGNQNSMPFSNVTIHSFDNMDDDPSISDMTK